MLETIKKGLYTRYDIAAIIGEGGVRLVKEWIRVGRLTGGRRIGRCIYYTADEINAAMNRTPEQYTQREVRSYKKQKEEYWDASTPKGHAVYKARKAAREGGKKDE